jgi:hypothetical protein
MRIRIEDGAETMAVATAPQPQFKFAAIGTPEI